MNFSLIGFTIPDVGVDVEAGVTSAITSMGGIVLIVIGGYAAFLIVKRGMKWAGKALG